MQSQVGNCFIEYIWPARGTSNPEVLDRFPFWSAEPDVHYFRNLAHAGVRSFYRSDHPHADEIYVEGSLRKAVPEAVRIVDQDGREICRWTYPDEYDEIQHHH